MRATGIFGFHGTERHPKDSAQGGDIIALAGLQECFIGDTVSTPEDIQKLPPIHVDEPTVSMVFQVNDGPFAGRSGGKFLTSRHLRERLHKEALGNVSIRIHDGDTPDQFRVMGRGELQLAVLIESLRRELYEFCVRKPEVVIREVEGEKQEPRERLVVDVPLEFTGVVNELIGPRKGILEDQKLEGERMRIEFLIPTRGLFGLRNQMLTSTKGTAIMHSNFEDWIPLIGPIPQRLVGSLVADRPGKTTAYALYNLQPRGTLFTDVGIDVYEGMIIGEHARNNCLNVNGVREKQLTNHRASGKDDATVVTTPRPMPLERCIEWIRDDEMVEVTPDMIRIERNLAGQQASEKLRLIYNFIFAAIRRCTKEMRKKSKVPQPRKWLGIHFECCHVYSRIYKHASGERYEGRCPRCLKMIRVRVAPGGSSNRIFRAKL